MRGRAILALAIPAGLFIGLLGGRFADPAMQDRSVNPYTEGGPSDFALQERPRQPLYSVAPQDLSTRNSYRPNLDYDAEVWDSDVARMEAERRGFHIDDYYAELDAAAMPLPAQQRPAPPAEASAGGDDAGAEAASAPATVVPMAADADGLPAIY